MTKRPFKIHDQYDVRDDPPETPLLAECRDRLRKVQAELRNKAGDALVKDGAPPSDVRRGSRSADRR
jgi:hypothetical protein